MCKFSWQPFPKRPFYNRRQLHFQAMQSRTHLFSLSLWQLAVSPSFCSTIKCWCATQNGYSDFDNKRLRTQSLCSSFTYNTRAKTSVRKMGPVVMQNVSRDCLDKKDIDRRIQGINILWNLCNLTLLSYPDLANYVFLNGPFYNWRYPLPPPRSVSHTLSLCLSTILLSYPPFPFHIKVMSDVSNGIIQ